MNKRAICPDCEYILSRCLCSFISPILNQIELIILQHPSETKHALNTVKLMKKSFHKIKVFVGENFNDDQNLKKILEDKNVNSALIFPNEKATLLTTEEKSKITHLILIDGSWNKAKKIFFSSTILHSLPSFSLNPNKESNYRIRSSKFEDSLSTLEASTLALSILEPELETNGIENAFVKMIDFQIEKMGEEIYRSNYLKKKSGD